MIIHTTSNAIVWVNPDHIIEIRRNAQDGSATIFTTDSGILETVESFNEIMDIVDPLLEGDTPEEMAANVIKGAANVPLSLLKRLLS